MIEKENPMDFVSFDEGTINIREEVEKYLYHWKWFVLGVIMALGVAYTYLRYTLNEYEVSATILIDDDANSGMPSELEAFEELGLMGGSKKNIANEMGILQSRSLMERVVENLEGNISYFREGRVRTSEVYKNDLPFNLTFFVKDSLFYKLDTTFTIQVLSNTTFKLSDLEKTMVSEHAFGENISTRHGDLTVTPMGVLTEGIGSEYIVKVLPLKAVAKGLRNAVQITAMFKKSSLVELKLKGKLRRKSQDILNELIRQYNNDAVEYKSLIGNNTETFINERLTLIEGELSKVDISAEEFKTSNKLSDISAEASLVLENNSEIEKKIIDLNTQLKLVEYVTAHMSVNKGELIPENLGLSEGTGVNSNSMRYNEVLLERNRIRQSSGKKNPVIINLDAQLSQLRETISRGLVNMKSSIEIALSQAMIQERRMSARISSAPKQEREYRDIQRQQQIIETLYLFLLEKREENAISLAVTTPNAKLIDAADGSNIPVSPKRKIVYLAALLLGIIIPFAIIYLSFLLDNKVHTSKELEALVKAPFLGDIPKTTNDTKVLLKEDRSSVAEAFRMLRTNINFMLGNTTKDSKAVYITSTVPGEGKTFIAINLATVLAMSNKKVLLVGADIRKPKVAEYLNVPSLKKGLSMFLTDSSIQVSEIIETIEETKFDMVQSGIVPPNPSELLMNGRFDEILAYGKEHYDYVIVDTAPINMVTDTLQLAQKADLFLYVVRANYLDKRLLEVPKKLYNEKRLPHMAMIMNGSDATKGYGYGYGYGYGEVEEKKAWYKR